MQADFVGDIDDGDFEYARKVYDQDPREMDEGFECENAPMDIGGGKLILAGVHDFNSTFEVCADVVVTMCSKPPRFPADAKVESGY